MALAAEPDRVGDLPDRERRSAQQFARPFDARLAQVAVRGQPGRLPEAAGEARHAEPAFPGQHLDRDVLVEVTPHVLDRRVRDTQLAARRRRAR